MKIRRLLVLTAVASWAGNCPMYVECPGLSEVLFTYLRNHVQQSYIEYVQEHTLTKDVENFVEALLSFMPKNPEEIIETAISEIIDEGPNMVTMYDLSELEPLPSPQRPATGTHNANPPPPARSPSWQSFRKVHGTFGLQRGYSSFGGPKAEYLKRERHSATHSHLVDMAGSFRLDKRRRRTLNDSILSRYRSNCTTTSSRLRQQDGLDHVTGDTVDVSRPCSGSSTKTFSEAMLELPALAWDGYVHCPACNQITSDSMFDHYMAYHQDLWSIVPQLAQGKEDEYFASLNPITPTLESLMMNTQRFAELYEFSNKVDGVTPAVMKTDTLMSLHVYTQESPIYRMLNEALRNGSGPLIDQWHYLITSITEALGHCPVYQGPAFRGIDVQLAPELYMPGHIVTWRSFASATTSAKVAREFLSKPKQEDAAPSGTLFILECMTAHCVQSVSVLPSEEEVLFGLNTQLRVLSRVSGGSMKLLEQAMELDLANTRVYELREVQLSTCEGILRALTKPERLQMTQLVMELTKHKDMRPLDMGAHDLYSKAFMHIGEYPEVVSLLLAARVPVAAEVDTLFCQFAASKMQIVVTPEVEVAMRAVVKAGVKVDAAQPLGDTALLAATERHNEDMVRILLELGANVHHVGRYNNTALMLAAVSGNPTITKRLLEHGARTCARDMWGNMPLDWALKCDQMEVVDLLEEAEIAAGEPQQYLPIRVPDITKVPPDLQNLHYLLLVGRQPPQSVTPGIVQGLMSILRGSGKCSPFLLRGAILSLARLLHKVEDEGPGRRILSDLRACKQMAFAALKEIWMQNENSDVRDAAELGLKLVGGEYGCRLIQAFTDVVTAARHTGQIWEFAPSGIGRHCRPDLSWDPVYDHLMSQKRMKVVYAAVHVIAHRDSAQIPLPLWQLMLDLLRHSVAYGRITTEFVLEAFVVHVAALPQDISLELESIAKELFLHSVYSNVREVARKLWKDFDKGIHQIFCSIFIVNKPSHQDLEQSTSGGFRRMTTLISSDFLTADTVKLAEFMCQTSKKDFEEMAHKVTEYQQHLKLEAFSRYYYESLQDHPDPLLPVLFFLYWFLMGEEVDTPFLKTQLQCHSRFMRHVALMYVDQREDLMTEEQVHRIVARTAKHDPISDIRQYAKNLLHRVKQAMPSKTSEMQEDYLQEEERVLAMLVRRVSVDSWDAPETDP